MQKYPRPLSEPTEQFSYGKSIAVINRRVVPKHLLICVLYRSNIIHSLLGNTSLSDHKKIGAAFEV
jgi:hypothetical protein